MPSPLELLNPAEPVDPGGLSGQFFDVVIAGAGHNALTCAAYLAASDLSVLVLEAHPRFGGACTLEQPWPGCVVSPCAYLCGLLHSTVIRDLELVKRGFHWTAAENGLFVPFPDGSHIQLFDDEQRCLTEVRRLAPIDVEGMRALGHDMQQLRAAIRPPGAEDFWHNLAPHSSELRHRASAVSNGNSILFDWSMSDLVEHYFQSDHLRMAYLGQGVIGTNASPFEPGTAFVRFHHGSGTMLGRGGAWGYVRGGMGSVSAQLLAAGREVGLQLAHGARVARIVPGEAVYLEGGERIGCRAVVGGFSPDQVLSLVDVPKPAAYLAKVAAVPRVGCTLKATLLLSGLPQFRSKPGTGAHHYGQLNTPLSAEEWRRGFAAQQRGELPQRLWTELYLQTAHEQGLAPAGKQLMSVFAQYVPHTFAKGDWDSNRGAVRQLLWQSLGDYIEDIDGLVESSIILGPPDIELQSGLPGGQIFQGEILPKFMWENRPNVRTPLEGLYLCGAGTNPGGSVMGINGRNAARALLEDWKRPWQWPVG